IQARGRAKGLLINSPDSLNPPTTAMYSGPRMSSEATTATPCFSRRVSHRPNTYCLLPVLILDVCFLVMSNSAPSIILPHEQALVDQREYQADDEEVDGYRRAVSQPKADKTIAVHVGG